MSHKKYTKKQKKLEENQSPKNLLKETNTSSPPDLIQIPQFYANMKQIQ